ncbi:MAG: ATP-binding protein [Pseudomonadota bacterium]|nr:ATP-binding protein [Pseudomonadota bacterium]
MLTLVVAQVVTFVLFARERVTAFRDAFLQDMATRLVSLVQLLEEAPPELQRRLVTTASSSFLRIDVAADPVLAPDEAQPPQLRDRLARELGKSQADVRVAIGSGNRRVQERGALSHGPAPWANLSVRLATGQWLNASADQPPVPRLGSVFLASFVISAIAVAAVGAYGMRRASRPLHQLAIAANRLGRGEKFELPETGPRETRETNIAFNRMRERIERFVRDRTSMLAAVAHDLRTPITSLRLRAEFVEEGEARAKILETLAEMQAMAEAVLAFARGDAETEPTRLTDLTALMESIVEDAAVTGKCVRFEDSPTLTLPCRPFALRRALGNLIENATFYGGRASARVESVPDGVRFVIDDDGPGIPETELERVFEPFVRLEGSRSRATGGAGLGLAIARTIARGHGGDVRLENRPEGGLRAILTLPGEFSRRGFHRARPLL